MAYANESFKFVLSRTEEWGRRSIRCKRTNLLAQPNRGRKLQVANFNFDIKKWKCKSGKCMDCNQWISNLFQCGWRLNAILFIHSVLSRNKNTANVKKRNVEICTLLYMAGYWLAGPVHRIACNRAPKKWTKSTFFVCCGYKSHQTIVRKTKKHFQIE